jgi:predicted DNA-binding transcriptional regulator YafY
MTIINILDILKKYTDAEHRLTQAEIVDILKKEYYMDVDRKTVKRNLLNLLDLNCGIEYKEVARKDEKGNDTSIFTDWYIQREFTDAELRFLIDSLLFSKNIPYKQCKELIKKLKSLSNIYFDKKVAHICNLPDNQPRNKEVFFNIDVLDEAISQNKKVSFTYNAYGTDKKLHIKREEKYIVNPYQMVATNGKYYLVCNYDKYDNLSNYRIDRITDIKILNKKRKPITATKEAELNLPKHMAEHIYMFAGESINAKFRAKNYIVDQLIDWFGTDISFTLQTDDECVAKVHVNKEAFFCWAMQYGLHIEVLEPLDMRNRIKDATKCIWEKYRGENDNGRY